MKYSVEGTIEEIMPLQSGVSKSTNKEWKSQDFVLVTKEQYPSHIVFTLFGDNIDKYPIKVNDWVNVTFYVDSRSFTDRNGVKRWSTSCKANEIEVLGETQPIHQPNYDDVAQKFFDNQPSPQVQANAPYPPQYAPQPQAPYNGYPVPQGYQQMPQRDNNPPF